MFPKDHRADQSSNLLLCTFHPKDKVFCPRLRQTRSLQLEMETIAKDRCLLRWEKRSECNFPKLLAEEVVEWELWLQYTFASNPPQTIRLLLNQS